MNTTFSIRVNEELKRSFLETAKSKWFDGAALLRHFMQKVSQSPNIVQFDIDESAFDNLFTQKTTVKKLEKISDKLDSLWF